LRQRRLELSLSVESVAEQTKIRKTYIIALKEERFEAFSGNIYVTGYGKGGDAVANPCWREHPENRREGEGSLMIALDGGNHREYMAKSGLT
jgi:hypothetical protein